MFHTWVACFLKQTVLYQNCTQIKGYLLNFLTMYIVNCSQMDISHIYISKSVAVYTGYTVTEHEGNMNMGQYYSW